MREYPHRKTCSLISVLILCFSAVVSNICINSLHCWTVELNTVEKKMVAGQVRTVRPASHHPSSAPDRHGACQRMKWWTCRGVEPRVQKTITNNFYMLSRYAGNGGDWFPSHLPPSCVQPVRQLVQAFFAGLGHPVCALVISRTWYTSKDPCGPRDIASPSRAKHGAGYQDYLAGFLSSLSLGCEFECVATYSVDRYFTWPTIIHGMPSFDQHSLSNQSRPKVM